MSTWGPNRNARYDVRPPWPLFLLLFLFFSTRTHAEYDVVSNVGTQRVQASRCWWWLDVKRQFPIELSRPVQNGGCIDGIGSGPTIWMSALWQWLFSVGITWQACVIVRFARGDFRLDKITTVERWLGADVERSTYRLQPSKAVKFQVREFNKMAFDNLLTYWDIHSSSTWQPQMWFPGHPLQPWVFEATIPGGII